jgi:hypothetical protein
MYRAFLFVRPVAILCIVIYNLGVGLIQLYGIIYRHKVSHKNHTETIHEEIPNDQLNVLKKEENKDNAEEKNNAEGGSVECI